MPETTLHPPGTALRIDGHVHLVGNGVSGSGCEFHVRGFWHRCLTRFMLRSIGLKVRGLDDPAFDQSYVDLLRDLLEEAPLDAIGLLAQDHVYHADGRRMEDVEAFYVPNSYLFEVCEAQPGFLPVVSIHPARADALDELDHCLKRGAVMLKLLPNCHNVNPSEPRYLPFWRRMAEAGLPLLAHTGSEYTLPVVAPELQDPRVLVPVLEAGVTVIAAHAATSSSPFSRDYFTELVEMMRRHPNLYADTSAWAVGLRGRHAAGCIGSEVESRLVHGSDFPVPVQVLPALLQGQIGWSDFLQLRKRRGALARDAGLKRSIGFKADHFTRLHHLLRLPQRDP